MNKNKLKNTYIDKYKKKKPITPKRVILKNTSFFLFFIPIVNVNVF